jgi:hypothetical protein
MMLTKLTNAAAASLVVSAQTVRQPPTAPPAQSPEISFVRRA